jgi:hypothetical protein
VPSLIRNREFRPLWATHLEPILGGVLEAPTP